MSHSCKHASTAIVPAYDHVFDLEYLYGVLQDAHQVEVSLYDYIGHIAMREVLPGGVFVTSLAGTRLSEQPIQRKSGRCMSASRLK
jgi:hypothetical protein